MMNLPAPRFVLRMFCEKSGCLRNALQKKIHAHGKIRGPNKTSLRVQDSLARNGKLLEPASRADHRVHAQNSEMADIYRRGFRRGEFNRHIDPAKRLVRKCMAGRVVPS